MPSSLLYLDANSTTPLDPRVADVMRHVAETAYANPGSSHQAGRQARRVLERARDEIAAILAGSPAELVFTSGATESIHLALTGLAASVPEDKRTLAISAGEHPATAELARRFQQQGWELVVIPLNSSGLIEPAGLAALPWERLGLISVIYANNETGVIQDVTGLRELAGQHGVLWHLDAVQAIGRIPVSVADLGATAVSFAVHKCHGPRGIGGLFLQAGVPFVPPMVGGFQEQSRRPGTEPVMLAAGMAAAMQLWHHSRDEIGRRLKSLRDRLESGLLSGCAPVVINGVAAPRLPNTSHVSFPGIAAEALLVALDLEGICCSLGSACASGSAEPSPVLLAMGLDRTRALSSLRFSLHRDLEAEDIEAAIAKISATVGRLREASSPTATAPEKP